MSVGSILLRVFLSVCLLLNGAGAGAVASAHGQAGTGESAVSAPRHAAMADVMPCHGGHDEAGVATPPERAVPQAGHPTPRHTPDCCTSGTCRCACVHIAQVGVPALPIPAIAPDHARSVRTLALGHAAPALPHPIRPPIG